MPEPEPRSKPLIVYDGECGFCQRAVRGWRRTSGDRMTYAAYQELPDPFAGVMHANFARSIHLIQPDGEILTGARAVVTLLDDGVGKRWPRWCYHHVPLVAPLAEWSYRRVARHRRAASVITRGLWGPEPGPATSLLTRWLFIRLLALVYLVAFASLAVQILGLIGSHGILPAGEFLGALQRNLGGEAFWKVPTLAWLSSTDGMLCAMCWGGAAFSVLVMLRIAPGPLLALCWILYLSLFHVGQTFLGFQWDLLLLETGLLAIFFAPWRLRPRVASEAPPSRLVLWLLRWLAFRLMFCSGVVKLLDEDPSNPTWHMLTALTYHYETQCIPNAIAWYAHQLPVWFQKLSVIGVFVIEIGIPFLIFLPRRVRIFAFFPLVFLQVLIILTGNYNFFNLLSIALCVTLLDDTFLRHFFPGGMVQRAAGTASRMRVGWIRRTVCAGVALVILAISGIWMVETFVGFRALPPICQDVLRVNMRFASINNYGLFRSMTTKRPEIIVEGSHDGRTWLTYEFKWKPGDPMRRPGFVAPHQPRLDWQMWFAALGDVRSPRNRWFVSFLHRLLEGEPDVLDLLAHNPFPDGPPRWIRAELFDYRFTDPATRRDTGAWWTRTRTWAYAPVLSLDSFRSR